MLSQTEMKRLWVENGEYRRRCVFGVSITRMAMCLGRMQACREKHPDAHAVSVDEIPAWIAEMREVMDAWPDVTEGGRDDSR